MEGDSEGMIDIIGTNTSKAIYYSTPCTKMVQRRLLAFICFVMMW
jgi:hypothetical protein